MTETVNVERTYTQAEVDQLLAIIEKSYTQAEVDRLLANERGRAQGIEPLFTQAEVTRAHHHLKKQVADRDALIERMRCRHCGRLPVELRNDAQL